MKYDVTITVNKPIDEAVQKFDDPNKYKEWMKGLEDYTTSEGTPNHVGAVSTMKFKLGKRAMDMTEKVIERNLPQSYKVSYEANKVYNEVTTKFEKIDAGSTQITTSNMFQFNGFVMKVMGFLMPGAFKKQSYKYLEALKLFIEKD